MSSDRIIQVERDILGKNDRLAADNRARFAADGVLAFNLVSSPGAGKTSLLVRAVSELKANFAIGVIEGDQQTSNDAERIRATGVPAIPAMSSMAALVVPLTIPAIVRIAFPDNAFSSVSTMGMPPATAASQRS